MARLIFITHPEVTIDPLVPVERWRLSDVGLARMRRFAESPVVADVTSVWASTEAKAIEAAGILAARFGIAVAVDHDLGENDRRSTGFLPPAAFDRLQTPSLQARSRAFAVGSGLSMRNSASVARSIGFWHAMAAETSPSSHMEPSEHCFCAATASNRSPGRPTSLFRDTIGSRPCRA